MAYCIIATVMLSTFVFAQAAKSSVVIENPDDLSSNGEARAAFCGLIKQCDVSLDSSKYSATLNNIQSRLNNLEKNTNFEEPTFYHRRPNFCEKSNRFHDYGLINNLNPVFWLSGSFYTGFNVSSTVPRTGLAPATDVLGNPVSIQGTVVVTNYRGHKAYMFDKTNSITSSASVSTKYTFAVVYRFPVLPTGAEGRFFTSPNGNKLFAGWSGFTQELYVEGWINDNRVRTTDTIILIGTNDNGVKNLWSNESRLVADSKVGVNDWGKVVIGRPFMYPNEAAQVNVYEAIVFDKVLEAVERYELLAILQKWYS